MGAQSAGWRWGCGLPAPGPQGAQHGIQRLERGLLLQPVALPGHQAELQSLQQLGHDHLHLHLRAEGGKESTQGSSEGPPRASPTPPPTGRPVPAQGLLPGQTAARYRSGGPGRRGSR